MLLEPMPTNAVALSLLDATTEARTEQEVAIVKARNYHNGNQLVFLTKRDKQFLKLDDNVNFCVNVCRGVVEAVAERMIVKGFDSGVPALKDWAAAVWQAARMDAVSDDVHEQALRDGEAFVIVEWNVAANVPRFFSHPRYTGTDAGGEGQGIVMVYAEDDVSQPPLYAVKRWIENTDNNSSQLRQRATLYYPDRIEKYFAPLFGQAWLPITDDDDEAWPLPWVDSAGKPLGIPVIHFKNKGLRSEAWDAIPLQDLINKTMVDLAGAADMTGFRMLVTLGFVPTKDDKPPAADGSNAFVIGPGQMIGTSKKAGEVDVKAIDGADLTPLLNLQNNLMLQLAMVTGTPVSRYQITGQVAAEGTLKQQEEPLLAKVRSREILFGDAWEDALNIARRLANFYGRAGLDEKAPFYTQWEDAQTRTDAERQAEWLAKKAIGIPMRQIWSEAGYSPEQIDTFLTYPEVANMTWGTYPAAPPAP